MASDSPPLQLAALARDIDTDDAELPPRQCGRCRMMFEGDPALDIRLRNEWCLCPACDSILLPARVRRANVVALRRPTAISAEPTVER